MTEETQLEDKTTVGNYFVSNYPPFSFWTPAEVEPAEEALQAPPADDRPLGIYVHIPFCRKRCDFCYFKVYTDKNSKDIRRYLDAVVRELADLWQRPYLAQRRPRFVYFGGGTPSYLSTDQMRHLFGEMRDLVDWRDVEEVTYECEPGTLSEAKIETLLELGVTRISLGVENFDPHVLEINNRAHRAEEIERTYAYARQVGFPSINIDLIAGMVGETDENWAACVRRTCELLPESVTVYQMEVPYNTTIYGRMKEQGVEVAPVADWETKRRWVSEAFASLAAVGYRQSSAYTTCLGDETRFVYRDALWRGADMLGLGVSSFSFLAGNHYQNEHAFEPYVARVEAGEIPVARALRLSDDERLRRELVLQLKLGRIEPAYFAAKFGVDVRERFASELDELARAGHLELGPDEIRVTPASFLRVDTLLPTFFRAEHRGARYA